MRAPEFAAAAIVMAVVGLCAATAASLLAGFGWPFELFSHFRIQYLAAAVLVAACALLLRRRAAGTAAIVVAALNSFNPDGLTAVRAAAAQSPCTGPRVTLATINVNFTNEQHERVLNWLAAHPADFVVIQEVTADWAASLTHLPGYPYRAIRVREDPYGIALLSAHAPESVFWLDLAGDGIPSVGADLEIEGQSVQVVGIHTRMPLLPAWSRARNRALDRAAERSTYGGLPSLVVGDLNLSPDSPDFTHLLQAGRLEDTMDGGGWRPTWMAGFWPLALRLDHVLASEGTCVVETAVGPDVGSDHRPVLVTLRLR
jgi:endonuclease/exonuclease/phosphatase (EEP) superfamily protein YafD